MLWVISGKALEALKLQSKIKVFGIFQENCKIKISFPFFCSKRDKHLDFLFSAH